MKRKVKIFGSIEKFEEQDDGTLVVSGIASSEAQDSDGEIILASAMKAAIPDYMKFGALREMHQPLAAGTALGIEVDEATKVTKFEARVVDPVACLKVKTGTYKAFSIGGRVHKDGRDPQNRKIITGLDLNEISLVDRPANPDAMMDEYKCFKADGPDDDPEDDGVEDPATKGETPGSPAGGDEGGGGGAAPGTPPPDSTHDHGTPVAPVTKGMFTVRWAATILEELDCLCNCVSAEASMEDDASPMPERIRSAVKDLAAILVDLVNEEVAEILANKAAGTTPPTFEPVTLERVAKALGLEIEKARFSRKARESIGAVHKALKDCDEKLAGLGYEQDGDEDSDKGAASGELQKALDETAAKVAGLEKGLAAAIAERDEFKKQLATTPAPPKGARSDVIGITKGQDGAMDEHLLKANAEAVRISEIEDPGKRALESIKFVQKYGRQPLAARA